MKPDLKLKILDGWAVVESRPDAGFIYPAFLDQDGEIVYFNWAISSYIELPRFSDSSPSETAWLLVPTSEAVMMNNPALVPTLKTTSSQTGCVYHCYYRGLVAKNEYGAYEKINPDTVYHVTSHVDD